MDTGQPLCGVSSSMVCNMRRTTRLGLQSANSSGALGIGAFIAIPCIKAHSFAGFCTAIAIVGSGLGSLETAANPYITGK